MQRAQIIHDLRVPLDAVIAVQAAIHIPHAHMAVGTQGFRNLSSVPIGAPGAGGFIHQRLNHDHLALNLAVLHGASASHGIAEHVPALGQGWLTLSVPELIPGVERRVGRPLMSIVGLDGDEVGIVQRDPVAGLNQGKHGGNIIHTETHPQIQPVFLVVIEFQNLALRFAGQDGDIYALHIIRMLRHGFKLQIGTVAAGQ